MLQTKPIRDNYVAGTLRWKAPELLDGSGTLTPATDVYAYSIVCIEVLTMGDIPWGQKNDDDIRFNVLGKFRRFLKMMSL